MKQRMGCVRFLIRFLFCFCFLLYISCFMLMIALPCFSPFFFAGFARACWSGYPFSLSVICSLCPLLRLDFGGNEAIKTGCSSQKNKFFVTFPDFKSLFCVWGRFFLLYTRHALARSLVVPQLRRSFAG